MWAWASKHWVLSIFLGIVTVDAVYTATNSAPLPPVNPPPQLPPA